MYMDINDNGVEGTFRDMNGNSPTLNKWRGREPDGGNCVFSHQGDSLWFDFTCTHEANFICEVQSGESVYPNIVTEFTL